MISKSSMTEPNRRAWLNGVSQAFPIVFGYIPVGFVFGILAQQAGISTTNTIAMSVLVYAGSAQLISVGLLSAGVSALSIIITTFVVNLRHMLMSAAISPYLKHWRKLALAAFAYQLTDETFAVHSTQFDSAKPTKTGTFTVNVTAQAAWIIGTWLGVTADKLITNVRTLGLDYALPAMFIALLVLQVKNQIHAGIALLSGILSIGFLFLGMAQWSIIIAAMIGATIGAVTEKWINV